MRYLKFTVSQGGRLLGSAAVMEQAIKAAKGYAVSTGAPVTVTGYRDDGQQKQVLYHPDGRIEKIWALCQSQPFAPKAGETYRNISGGTYRCRWVNGTVADMINVKSGWSFLAHGCRRYFDGSIEWDYSTDGYFAEAHP